MAWRDFSRRGTLRGAATILEVLVVIAIVGLACRFPGARNSAEFWENIVSNHDCTRDAPPDRWSFINFLDPSSIADDVSDHRPGWNAGGVSAVRSRRPVRRRRRPDARDMPPRPP